MSNQGQSRYPSILEMAHSCPINGNQGQSRYPSILEMARFVSESNVIVRVSPSEKTTSPLSGSASTADKIFGATTPASPVIERKPEEMGEVRGVLRRSPAIVRVEVKPPPHKQRATCGIEGKHSQQGQSMAITCGIEGKHGQSRTHPDQGQLEDTITRVISC